MAKPVAVHTQAVFWHARPAVSLTLTQPGRACLLQEVRTPGLRRRCCPLPQQQRAPACLQRMSGCLASASQVSYLSFSAHADAKGILQLVSAYAPKAVMLVHGDKAGMDFMAGRIHRCGEGEHAQRCGGVHVQVQGAPTRVWMSWQGRYTGVGRESTRRGVVGCTHRCRGRQHGQGLAYAVMEGMQKGTREPLPFMETVVRLLRSWTAPAHHSSVCI